MPLENLLEPKTDLAILSLPMLMKLLRTPCMLQVMELGYLSTASDSCGFMIRIRVLGFGVKGQGLGCMYGVGVFEHRVRQLWFYAQD